MRRLPIVGRLGIDVDGHFEADSRFRRLLHHARDGPQRPIHVRVGGLKHQFVVHL